MRAEPFVRACGRLRLWPADASQLAAVGKHNHNLCEKNTLSHLSGKKESIINGVNKQILPFHRWETT